MKILYAYNEHRGGNGSLKAIRAAMEISRRNGLEVEAFTRSSKDLPDNLLGRLRAGTSAIYAPGSVKEFAALLDSYLPDVVHIYDVFPLVSPWILPQCTQRGVPVVMSCSDYHLTCPVRTHLCHGQICTRCLGGREHWAVLKNCRGSLPESLTFALYSAMVRRLGLFHNHVSRFIAPSEFTRQWLIEHTGIDPARITALAPVVDIPKSVADPGVGSYVGFAGRFVPEKGIDTFLEAARLCRLPFRMTRNENHAATVPLPPDVDVVVTSNTEDLNTFYRDARMLVFPSLWFETFGLVGAEAMSHGIPVVASRIGALSFLVEDGVDGLLFEPGNPRDLAEKITRLWTDPDLCRRFGRVARQKATRLWSAQHHFEKLMAVYENVCCRDMSGAARG